jgi:hypothetical protein
MFLRLLGMEQQNKRIEQKIDDTKVHVQAIGTYCMQNWRPSKQQVVRRYSPSLSNAQCLTCRVETAQVSSQALHYPAAHVLQQLDSHRGGKSSRPSRPNFPSHHHRPIFMTTRRGCIWSCTSRIPQSKPLCTTCSRSKTML